jgi:hypothetical protein
METIAIISYLSYLVFALLAVILCVILFRYSRQRGWLLVSVTFLQPFWLLFIHAIQGRHLLPYMTVVTAPDGSQRTSVPIDFPVFYIVAIIGLYLLVQKARRDKLA